MSILGIGNIIASLCIPLSITLLLMQYMLGITMPYTHLEKSFFIGIFGGALLFVGIFSYTISAAYLLCGRKKKRLVTKGPFKLCRNPMYSCFIFLLIPAISILLNNALFLIVSLIFFLVVLRFIAIEEGHLQFIFGKEYQKYRSSTPQIIPFTKRIKP